MSGGRDNSGPRRPTGAERRRFIRSDRRIGVTFTLEGEEYGTQTLDVSKTGALFIAPVAPTVGTRLLLNLSDRDNPELSLHLKSTVVRSETGTDGRSRFAVEFGDAVALNPKRLRLFLEKVLGIGSGLIRVLPGEEGEERRYAFSFESVRREGDERVKALEAALFRDFAEMEEADAILAGFGRTPVASGLEDSKLKAPLTVRVGEEGLPAGGGVGEQLPAGEVPEEFAPRPEQSVDGRPVAGLTEPAVAAKGSFLGRLFGGGKSSRGEALITTSRVPTVVANDVQIPVVYRMGTTRYQGTAVRLYCAGLKIKTEQKLPQLYAAVTVMIPLAGGRKISHIELVGDVTRVRAERDESESGGLFEMRLSMRTDKNHLELFRLLLEKLAIGPAIK